MPTPVHIDACKIGWLLKHQYFENDRSNLEFYHVNNGITDEVR